MLANRTLATSLILSVAVLTACNSSSETGGEGGSGGLAGGGAGGSAAGGAGGGGSGGSDGTCRDSDDCDASILEDCYAPGDSLPCGICHDGDNPCTTDSECETSLGSEYVCGPSEGGDCSCGNGNCTLACTGPTDCELTEECDAEGHCVPKECTVDGDCDDSDLRCPPTTLVCVLAECDADPVCGLNHRCSETYQCVRRSCSTDADCDGYCVNSACHEALGTCEPPAA